MTALDRLQQVVQAIRAHRDHMLKVRHNLTGSQYDLLYTLYTNGVLSFSEAAELLGCTQGNMTGLTVRLERNGWVTCTRGTEDRRRYYLRVVDERTDELVAAMSEVQALEDEWTVLLEPIADALDTVAEALVARAG